MVILIAEVYTSCIEDCDSLMGGSTERLNVASGYENQQLTGTVVLCQWSLNF
jgi:hypothetical protein